METFRIRMEKSRIRDPDKHPGSATLDPPRSFNAGAYWRNRIHNLVQRRII